MAMNPMQRKANNSFLLGIFVTLLFTGVIIAILFMQMSKMKSAENQRLAQLKTVYVASSDIESGNVMNVQMLKQVDADAAVVPADAITTKDINDESEENKTIAKIAIKSGTIVTAEMLSESENPTTDDLRTQEYGVIVIPTQIKTGDYVDVRLRLPNGQDYIVVSKKEVTIPQIDGVDSETMIHMDLKEDETLTISNAIVEAFMMRGSYLYATTYVEAGLQAQATPTYVPNAEVQALVYKNPNIVNEAKNSLIKRYNENVEVRQNYINSEINKTEPDEIKSQVEENVQREIEAVQTERAKYLNALSLE